MNNLSAEEQEVASVVAGLAGKREREDSPDAAGGMKKNRGPGIAPEAVLPPVAAAGAGASAAIIPAEQLEEDEEELNPYPFFYYKDYSAQKDPDSLTPVTPPGRVPNFPAKMHAILSRLDLADVVCWMPHGRSWKVLKPREFEIRVIPTYFEHAKFSSFIRQANGWGFRRLTTGRDRNSYYHPLFLRAIPHLCKDMKRPGVAKKLAADPDHEPDLYKISEMHPVPTTYEDDSILLQCTLQGGPKARMPIYSGSFSSSYNTSTSFTEIQLPPAESKKAAAASITAPVAPQLTPRDQEALTSFQASLEASEVNKKPAALPRLSSPAVVLPQFTSFAQITSPVLGVTLPANSVAAGSNKISTLAAANQLAFGNPNLAAAFQASSAASQFAAGFAAAAALSHQQFQNMLSTLQHHSTQTPHNFSAPK